MGWTFLCWLNFERIIPEKCRIHHHQEDRLIPQINNQRITLYGPQRSHEKKGGMQKNQNNKMCPKEIKKSHHGTNDVKEANKIDWKMDIMVMMKNSRTHTLKSSVKYLNVIHNFLIRTY